MRRPRAAWMALAAVAAAGCNGPSPDELAAQRYLREASYRRAEMLASQVNPANGYSRLRAARYESGDARDWARLPEWNPRAEPVPAQSLATPGPARVGPDAEPLAISAPARAGDLAALRALGERAFFRYPAQQAPESVATTALGSRASAARYGFWVDARRDTVAGLLREQYPDGTSGLAFSCATCHAAPDATGALVVGVGNARLDLGALAADASPGIPPDVAARVRAWGPGRVDVTTSDGSEPVAIPDLRSARFVSHLHRSATVAQRNLAALAVRLETLIITSRHGVVRPPREVALGLAVYLWSLGDALPTVDQAARDDAAARRGRAHFDARCASCHAGEELAGAPVPLAVVGTDPAIGLSPDRTTGFYRVPSLRGVGTRTQLLHDGAAPRLEVLLDPARVREDYAQGARGPGPIAGHAYGLDLAPDARADLLALLRRL